MRSKAQIKSHPIHPMLVSFPIGLWVTSFVLDLISKSNANHLLFAAGFYCVIAGCIGAVLAAVAGVVDLFGSIPPRSSARNRGYIHGAINSLALLLFIAVAWLRGSADAVPTNLTLLLSFIGVVGIGISGWLGGTLVYRNQIGVDHRYANSGSFKQRVLQNWNQPAFNKSELSDGQMMLVTIAGERIAAGLCKDGVFAIADRCTHKGGPLFDGALVGCAVQCPWHGSQFDVVTGRVISGPAESKIKTYETEVRGGEVYIKKSGGQKKAA